MGVEKVNYTKKVAFIHNPNAGKKKKIRSIIEERMIRE